MFTDAERETLHAAKMVLQEHYAKQRKEVQLRHNLADRTQPEVKQLYAIYLAMTSLGNIIRDDTRSRIAGGGQ